MNFDIKNIVRSNVLHLKPYSSARDEFQGKAEIFLDANENPFDSAYNRYPDPLQQELRDQIATLKKIDPERLALGNGSDEIIDLLFRIFCTPGVDNVIIPQPTYGMYKVSAAINEIEVREPLLSEGFDINESAIKQSIDQKSKILFLCSPNNPTGNVLSVKKIEELLLYFSGIVVVDEAYIDFAESQSLTTLLDKYPNLVILQTLSKAWGLAGLRIGIGFASKEIVSFINKIKPPYNISSASAQGALQAIVNTKNKNEFVQTLIKERERMELAINNFPFVQRVFPSQANFLLVRMDNARNCYAHLLEYGIVVRDRSNVILCEDCLRITIGTPSQNVKLLDALKRFN
ncbi:MAG TPA: histidinol-phosphate transaminase [Cyclobacteriaceae bacterium]|nr:histidinol-phosphate transaminase [Cyclobacteriaceae bacterium]